MKLILLPPSLEAFDPFPDNAVSSLTANVYDVQSFVMDRSFLSYILLIY